MDHCTLRCGPPRATRPGFFNFEVTLNVVTGLISSSKFADPRADDVACSFQLRLRPRRPAAAACPAPAVGAPGPTATAAPPPGRARTFSSRADTSGLAAPGDANSRLGEAAAGSGDS